MIEAGTTNQQTHATTGDSALVFDEFRLDLAARTLSRSGERIAIQRKPLEVLVYLVSEAPRLVPREELLQRFWSRSVNDEALTRCVSTIRSLLSDTDDPPRLIETHRAQGYRFIADVRSDGANAQISAPPPQRRRRLPRIASAGIAIGAIIALAILAGRTLWPVAPADPDVADRIAVLPITAVGDYAEWLPVALTDHLIAAVAKIEGVTVVAGHGLSPGADPQVSGSRLNVDALLLTRLERRGDESRLSATLVSTDDGRVLWTSSVDTPEISSDGVPVDSLARQMAKRLQPMLQLQAPLPAANPEAYRLYLQGRYYSAQRSASGLNAAVTAFDRALEIDPDYVDAMLGAAESWLVLPLYGATAPLESIPRSRAFAERALEIDPDSSRAKAVLGAIAMQFDWDWPAAETLLRDAIALNPNDATAQRWLGELSCYRSRRDACARQFEIARDLDPLSPVVAMQQGSVFLYDADYENAVDVYEGAASVNPDFSMGHYALGLANVGLSRWQEAIRAYEKSLPGLGLEIVGGPMAFALAKGGDREAAERVLNDVERLATERYVPPSKIAIAYLGLGDPERARELFWTAIEMRDDRLVYFAVDVHTRNLVEDPYFVEIVERLGLVPSAGFGS